MVGSIMVVDVLTHALFHSVYYLKSALIDVQFGNLDFVSLNWAIMPWMQLKPSVM